MSRRPVMVLLASRELRRGPDSPLIRFVRAFEHYFRHVRRPDIHILEGSYRALLRNGLLTDYDGLHPVASGRQGGLVALADLIVQGTGDGRRVDEVVYLLDPRDATSMFPDSQAIKRECVVTRTAFLATAVAASEWFALDWAAQAAASDPDSAERAWFTPPERVRQLLPAAARYPAGRRIALIAHDAYKAEMLEFGAERFDFLGQFEQRYATGTTGGLLNGTVPDRIRERWAADAKEARAFEATGLPPRLGRAMAERERVEAAVDGIGRRLGGRGWIDAQPSGPLGGDIRVAEAVRRGECDTVLFFEDPHVSREHEADIQLLERATRIPGSEAICLHDPDTVRRWAAGWARCQADGLAPPLTLVETFRRLWGVELVLPAGRHRGAGNPGWSGVTEAGSWYLSALLDNGLACARERGGRYRVALGWGRSVAEIVGAVEGLRGGLRERQSREALTQPLVEGDEAAGPRLTVQPTVGILGLPDQAWEANRQAEVLAGIHGGRAEAITRYAFPAAGSGGAPDAGPPAPDAVLVSAGRLGDDGLPLPAALRADLERDAVGEIGGLFLGADGRECRSTRFAPVGVRADDLRGVRRRGGRVVLVAGRRTDELDVALAAVSSGLVTTLVTDNEFARGLLEAAARGPRAAM